LVGHVGRGARVIRQVAVSGGRANTNLHLSLDVAPWNVLLRVYQRDPGQAAKEFRLDQILRDAGVPTARFLAPIALDEPTGLTYAVLDWIDGERLDLSVPGSHDLAAGQAVGEALARVHRIDIGPAGFLSPDSRPLSAITSGGEAMARYIHACIVEGPGAARLGPELTRRLVMFVAEQGDRLADWACGPGLVHGDCNPSNFIMRDGGVAALLDWEFAFSGAAIFDFGNLLRPPIGLSAEFAEGLAAGYRAGGQILPRHWFALARLADLYAWADFLGRAVVAREVVADARQMVAETLDYFDREPIMVG
jgi:aminoglycoside phosphotransferase (APT) family kinase protein